jgi:uncharacterized repeat protein (TIGR01451 family)
MPKRVRLIISTLMVTFILIFALFELLAYPRQTALAAPDPDTCTIIDQDITTDTTWDAACYHIITSTVSIQEPAHLTISPGVWVFLESNARMQVNQLADLTAIGTANQPITFTSASPAGTQALCDWNGILINSDNGPGITIHHALIEYACVGIRSDGRRNLDIQHTNFRYNGFNTPNEIGGAIVGNTGFSLIAENHIHNCQHGIHLNETGHTIIRDNHLHDLDGYGIALVRGDTSNLQDQILTNTLYNFQYDGIHLEEGSKNEVHGNIIYAGQGAGIVLESENAAVIQANQIYSTALGTGAEASLVITAQTRSAQVEHNHIFNNGAATNAAYRAAVYVQAMESSMFGGLAIHRNVISDSYGSGIIYGANNQNTNNLMDNNALCTAAPYRLANWRAGYTVDAPNSWWSTNVPTTGAEYIGHVDVSDWLTLAVSGNARGAITVTLRNANGDTVPPHAENPAIATLPNARRITLASNWGAFDTDAVTMDDTGTASTTFTPGSDPAPATVLLTATDFCGYAVSAPLALPDLVVTKTTAISQVLVGDVFTYTISYANIGADHADVITLTDMLPNGITWVGDTAPSPWTREQTTPHVIWTRPDLAAGAQGSFVVSVTVATTDTCGETLDNLALIESATLERHYGNNADHAPPVSVLCPALDLTKTGPTLSKATDPAVFTFCMTNTSVPAASPPLMLDSIVDTGVGWAGLGDLTAVARAAGCDLLPIGDSCCFSLTHTVLTSDPDPLTNRVTATYILQGFAAMATASDSHTTNLFQPGIAFEKTGDPLSKIGDSVDYTVTLTNTSSSDAPPLACTLTDPLLGLTTQVTLTAGQIHTVVTSYTVPVGTPDPFTNTAEATCSPLGFPNTYTATATHSVNLFQPGIAFDKTGDPLSKVGDSVDYTVTLTNTSSSDAPPLACTLTDPLLGLTTQVTLTAGQIHTVVTSYTVPVGTPDPFTNTAEATCSPLGFPNTYTATATHSVNLFQPSIQVTKLGPREAFLGSTLTYEFWITNTGSNDSPALDLARVLDVGEGWSGLGDLTSVAQAAGCDPLAAGASCHFTTTHPLPTTFSGHNALTNTVTITYHPRGFPNTITSTDSHATAILGGVDLYVIKDDRVGPTITDTLHTPTERTRLTDLLNRPGIQAPQATPHRAFVLPGDVITYPIFICNYGPITATDIVLTETIPEYTTYIERGHNWTHVATRTYTTTIGPLPPNAEFCRTAWMTVRVDEALPADLNNLDNLVCARAAEAEIEPLDNCDHEDTPVRHGVDITKTVLGPTITSDGTYFYDFGIEVHNTDAAGFDEAYLTDELPPALHWYSDTALLNGWISRTVAAHEVTWYTPTLAAGAHSSFTLRTRVEISPEDCNKVMTNTVLLTVQNGDIGRYLIATDTVTFIIQCPADLWAIKNDKVGPVTPLPRLLRSYLPTAPTEPYREYVHEGDLVTYTIVAGNAGPYTSTNVVITETLPLHTDYVGYNWIHVGGRTYITHLGTLPPNGPPVRLEFIVRVHDPITASIDAVYNRVCIGSTTPDLGPLENCWDEDTPVRVRYLRIRKTAPRCVIPGLPYEYTPYYTNTHPTRTFYNVPVTDTLPISVSYAGSGPWQCQGRDCALTVPTIPAGAHDLPGDPLRVRLDHGFTGTTLTNTIAISDYTFTLVHQVDTGPDLSIVKNDNIGPLPRTTQQLWDTLAHKLNVAAPRAPAAQPINVHPGDRITYTILYLNQGMGVAHNVVITEHLPAHTRYIGGGWTQVDDDTYIINVDELSSHQGGQLQFIVEVLDPVVCGVDRIINQVEIVSDEEECNTSNNNSNDDTPLETGGQIAVSMRESNSIEVYDTSNFEFVRSIPVGPHPFGILEHDGKLYVASSEDPANPNARDYVYVYNIDTGHLLYTVLVGAGPLNLTTLNDYIYVTNHGPGYEGITVFEHTTGIVDARLTPTGLGIEDWGYFGITADPTRSTVYPTKHYLGGEGLWRIPSPAHDALTRVVNTTPITDALSLAYLNVYNPATDQIYVTFPHLNEVRSYDPETYELLARVDTEQQAVSSTDIMSTNGGKGLDDLESCVYVSNFAARSVTVITQGSCLPPSYNSTPTPPESTPPSAPPDDDDGTITIFMPTYFIYLPALSRNFSSDSPAPPSLPLSPSIYHIDVSGRPKGLVAGDGCVFVTLPEENRVDVIDVRSQEVITTIHTLGDYPQTNTLFKKTP